MREKFICTHFVISWNCKIDSKAHFSASPPPHLFRPEISVFPTFPRFEPYFGRFFEGSHSFFAPRSPFFSRLSSFWVQFREIFRGTLPFFALRSALFLALPRFEPDFGRFFERSPLPFSSALPFSQNKPIFPIRAFPFTRPLPHLHLRIYSPSGTHSPLAFTPHHFLLHSSPLFHLSSQLTNKRAHPRALLAYTYERTHLHVRRFSFIAFTSSPTSRDSLCINTLGVKENEKKPSKNTQLPHYQQINYKIPISSAVNPIYRRREPKNQKPSPLTHCATTTCDIRVKE